MLDNRENNRERVGKRARNRRRGNAFWVKGTLFAIIFCIAVVILSGCAGGGSSSGGGFYNISPGGSSRSYVDDAVSYDMIESKNTMYEYEQIDAFVADRITYSVRAVDPSAIIDRVGSVGSVTAPTEAPDPEVDGVVEEDGGGVRVSYTIRDSSIGLDVVNLEEAAEQLRIDAEHLGGFVANLNFYDLTSERRSGYLTIRIPADKYDQMMDKLQELGIVRNKNESSHDVTLEYVELDVRIENLAAQEQRIRELLENAKSIEEILMIENELTRIRGDLESMLGHFKYMQDRVRYSTISVNIIERDPRALTAIDGFGSFGSRLVDQLSLNMNRLIKGLTNFVIYIIGYLPILIPVFLLLWFLVRRLQARRARKKQQRESLIKESNIVP